LAVPSRFVPSPVLETVTTTIDPDGRVNCAAMGVQWPADGRRLVFHPYRATRTYRNLSAVPSAVVHLTDDVLLFCQAALGDPQPPTVAATHVAGAVLVDACSWREVRVERIDDDGERVRVEVEVVASGQGREHLGLNRARHAVVEASILASRLRLLGADEVERQLALLEPLMDKTAGPRERAAMAYVREHLARRGIPA
jgi:hypothetical protein